MIKKLLVATITSICCLGASAQMAGGYRPGQLLVKFKDSNAVSVKARIPGKRLVTSATDLNSVLEKIGAEDMAQLMPLTGKKVSQHKVRSFAGKVVEDKDLSQLYLLTFDASTDVKAAVSSISSLEEVEYAEPNYLVYTQGVDDWGTNDPLYSQQWGLGAVNMSAMWTASAATADFLGRRPVIAIIDTGVDITHPDLVDNIWTNESESENGVDDDGNGYKDDIHGWDFVNQTSKIGDYNGHGTHCAGIAAASGGNGEGIVGANPDALIMPLTALQSNGSGDVATIIKAIDYASANGADVISMSIGGYVYSKAEDQALGKAYNKCFLVAAAGNDSRCITDTHAHTPVPMPCYPAAFTYVLGVMATTDGGYLAGYSNYDDDGAVYSEYNEEKLYNYEISAPGSSIISTYPGGRYKVMNGTSMACPLVAGFVSRMLQSKEVLSKELLFGDIIHTANSGILDALATYNITDADRKHNIYVVNVAYADSLGDKDGRIDAGETVDIYPTVRNDWGNADNVTLSVEMAENEDTSLVEFISNDQPLGCSLSSYGKVKTQNPLQIKISDKCVDGRIIRLVIRANCDNMSDDFEPQEIQIKVENGVELGGTQRENITLEPDVHYIVSRNWGIPKDVTVTVKAGTTIKIKDGVGISNYGYMLFEGTADSLITITKGDNDSGTIGNFLNDNANYVDFNYVLFDNLTNITFNGHRYNNCIIRNCNSCSAFFTQGATFKECDLYNNTVADPYLPYYIGEFSSGSTFLQTTVHDNIMNQGFGSSERFYQSNYIGNEVLFGENTPGVSTLENSNCYGNYYDFKYLSLSDSKYVPGYYTIIYNTTEPEIAYTPECFLGTFSKDVAYKEILDTEDNFGWGTVDVALMRTDMAIEEAPGCVEYVKVDSINALDNAEDLAPLGMGKHKFIIGFNRAMNQKVAPTVSMGVRPPYTQNMIAEDGYWFDPYTYVAYLTIDGKTATDGTNRIRIYGYQQKGLNPEFELSEDYYRYNVKVSAAGSMSTGMIAEAGLGKINLTWETAESDFDDLLGYNIYRYTVDDANVSSDTVLINSEMIDSDVDEYTDYDVVPGTAYYYFIKEIGTDLVENDISSVVCATPLTAQKGDANGSLAVDIADVLAEISYLSDENPVPFIFEAADVNSDSVIDILDVVGTLRIITNPDVETESADDDATAYCYIKDGKLYVNSSVAIGGAQIQLMKTAEGQTDFAEGLYGMEQMDAKLKNGEDILLAYSMSGVTIPAGEQELLSVDDSSAKISNIVLSTPRGRNINVIFDDPTSIISVSSNAMNHGNNVYDLTGRKLSSLPKHGIVIVDGKKVRL